MKVVATQRGTKGAADQHAERMGWEVMRVFKDEGRSGYSGEFRPGFEDMLKSLARAASRC
jgi:DNA invertase Pin-like site-specific DNA recombinase